MNLCWFAYSWFYSSQTKRTQKIVFSADPAALIDDKSGMKWHGSVVTIRIAGTRKTGPEICRYCSMSRFLPSKTSKEPNKHNWLHRLISYSDGSRHCKDTDRFQPATRQCPDCSVHPGQWRWVWRCSVQPLGWPAAAWPGGHCHSPYPA